MPVSVILVTTASLVASGATSLAEDTPEGMIRNAVVKVIAVVREPDVIRPWTKSAAHELTGSGTVIRGNRILTAAHLVLHASQVSIQPEKSGEKLTATVEATGPGIDLAILKLDDEAFFKAHPPLEIGKGIPANQEVVVVYGYPLGGMELAVTKGIVSRAEYSEYQFLTQGLRIQVDAAINPGNSGGPAVVDGKMVGTIFSRLPQSDNIGYIIAVEEIERFLKDIVDGHYDGKPVFIDEVQPLVNPALRRKMGLDKAATGVLVTKPVTRDPSYPLKPGDVITRIGDQVIDNTGMVQVEGDRRLSFHYLVQRHARDHRLGLTVLRGGRERKVEIPVNPGRDVWLFPYLKDRDPSYLVYGPLAFTEVTDDFIRLIAQLSGGGMTLAFQGNPMVTRYGHRPAFEGERIVVVAHPMFTHRLGTGYRNPFLQAVGEVNGVRIRNLKHLAETLRDAAGEYVEITFQGNQVETIVFPRKEAIEATEEVLNDNGIRQRCSPDLITIWDKSK